MDWLSACLAEYKAVWDEKMATLSTQQSTLRIGTAIVGALLVAGLNLWGKPVVASFILLFLVPVVSYLSLIIWMGELQRMVRCKIFLAALEQSINKALCDARVNLSWENWLRGGEDSKHPRILKWNYRAILVIFLLIAVVSATLGIYKISEVVSAKGIVLIAVFELLAVLGVVFWYVKVVKTIYRVYWQAAPREETLQPISG